MRNRLLLLSAAVGVASMAIAVPAALAASGSTSGPASVLGSAAPGFGEGRGGSGATLVQAPSGEEGARPARTFRHGPEAHFTVTEAAAEVLGITPEELRDGLAEGQSILDYAVAQGEDAEAFTAAVTDAVRADIQEAVAAGEITQDEAAAALDDLDQRVAETLASTHTPHGRGGGCPDGAAPDGESTPNEDGTPDDASTEA